MRRSSRRVCSILSVWLAVGPELQARTVVSSCGTERGRAGADVAASAAAGRMRKRMNAAAQQTAARPADAGEIAVMDDAGGVIARSKPFALSNKTVTFLPTAAEAPAYRYSASEAAMDAEALEQGEVLSGLGDDDARQVDLPFPFTYYGREWRQAWVQSDGNVTFGSPEMASAARSLGRMAAGPPRLAPLFSDLDPTRPDCDVRVWKGADRLVVSWRNVPEYQDVGTGARQTLQLVLWADGRIEFRFARITASAGVVGISPGGLLGSTEVVNFLDASTRAFEWTVADTFGTTDGIDMVRVAQRFYESHEDAYDYLVVFNTLGIAAQPGALAYESTVRNYRTGIGDAVYDSGASYGSEYRLQAVLNMGPLRQYPRDPYARVGSRGLLTGDNTMTLIGHETGHLFLALASIRDPLNPDARPMLGTQLAHWSFNFNSEASLLEGNRIQDNGPGLVNRFLTVGTVEGYSALDQYLMGLRHPLEVPPTFLVKNSNRAATLFPQTGVSISGTRQDITVDDVIAAEGPRIPEERVSQRLFRFAFIVITPAGTAPAADEAAQLETYRSEFERFYHRATGERAWADATLRKMVRASMWPAGGSVAGEEARIQLRIARPAEADLRVQVARAESVEAPEFITIPAGATTAQFALRPLAAGTTDVLLIPEDSSYETGHVRLETKAARSELTLEEYYREPGLLVLRVTDPNRLNYSNQPVLVESVEGAIRSDLSGLIWLTWDGNPLTAQLEGAPGSSLVIR
ncbi:MAG: hypothetical protein HY821_16880 [Acidobacteria bacterium]|nr:hypothetical protein [Acidobacteriota bacterium]